MIMRFNIGDIIYNESTQEEGRVVRFASPKGDRSHYIVSVMPTLSGGTVSREALWRESEVKRSAVPSP
jgi:hypothetical protein